MQQYNENIRAIVAHLHIIKREMQREIAATEKKEKRYSEVSFSLSDNEKTEWDALCEQLDDMGDKLDGIDTAIEALRVWEG